MYIKVNIWRFGKVFMEQILDEINFHCVSYINTQVSKFYLKCTVKTASVNQSAVQRYIIHKTKY